MEIRAGGLLYEGTRMTAHLGAVTTLAVLLMVGATLRSQATAAGDPAKGPAAGDGAFDPAPVLRIRIDLSEESLQGLRDEPRTYVRGTVREGDLVLQEVGVRLKGSVGSFQPVDGKPGFSLKFDRFVPEGRFHGLRKLILDNCDQDPTAMSEMIGNEIFRAAGIPAPRNGYAMVELNGRALGLYVVTEAATRQFLERWFEDASGVLYEGPRDIDFDLDIDSGKSDRSDLRALAEAAREKDPAKRIERLEKLLDLDRFIAFIALEAVACHWDGYAQGKNNYRIYHDPKSDRMVFIPHGIDQLFQNSSAPLFPTTSGLVARAVLRTPEGRKRYREKVRLILDEVLDLPAIEKRVRELGAKIRGANRRGIIGSLVAGPVDTSFAARIAARVRSARDQLDGKVVISAGPALPFDASGRARLSGWQARYLGGGSPRFSRLAGGGERGGIALRCDIGDGGPSRATWRLRVCLPPGKYRFAGRVRIEGVVPANVELNDAGRGGADLRISRDQPESKLEGDRGWTTSSFDFEIDPVIEGPGEQPTTQVELVCELQASAGMAWFDEASLELRRLP
jgi:spore coat protein H